MTKQRLWAYSQGRRDTAHAYRLVILNEMKDPGLQTSVRPTHDKKLKTPLLSSSGGRSLSKPMPCQEIGIPAYREDDKRAALALWLNYGLGRKTWTGRCYSQAHKYLLPSRKPRHCEELLRGSNLWLVNSQKATDRRAVFTPTQAGACDDASLEV
jgi:hypothetical protein